MKLVLVNHEDLNMSEALEVEVNDFNDLFAYTDTKFTIEGVNILIDEITIKTGQSEDGDRIATVIFHTSIGNLEDRYYF